MKEYLLPFLPLCIIEMILDYLKNVIVIVDKYDIYLFDGQKIVKFIDAENYKPEEPFLHTVSIDFRNNRMLIFSFPERKWIDFINVIENEKDWMRYNFIKVSSFIYFFGQNRDNSHINKTYQFDLRNNTSKELPSMNTFKYSHIMVSLNNKLYSIGGVGKKYSYLNTVECYNNTSWINCSSLKHPLTGHQCVVYGEKIYVFGGYNLGANFLTVERYDPETDQWTEVTKMPIYRKRFNAIVLENKIYIIGELDSVNSLNDKIDIYSPNTNTWTVLRTGISLHDVHLGIL